MTASRLLLLLLLEQDELTPLQRDCGENDEDWSWLYVNNFIIYTDEEKPQLLDKGYKAVTFAVKKADELC
jgi:hypothetical protein